MKKAIVLLQYVFVALLFALAFYCVYPEFSYANPPQNVRLEYDMFFKNLTVTITHKSGTTDKHYIKSVNIKKNGNAFSTNTYTSQPDSETFIYTYKVPAEDGDVLEVTAQCSIFGNKQETFAVKKD